MPIGNEQVQQIARLAKLQLSQVEIESLSSDLSSIVDYISKLDELDSSGMVPLLSQDSGRRALRKDEPAESLTVSEALSNSPESDPHFFLVPKVIKR